MHWIRLSVTAIALQGVAACSLLEQKPAPAPPPQAAPAPVRQPGDDLPYRPLPQAQAKPVAKPPVSSSTAKPVKPAPSHAESITATKPAAAAEPANEGFVPRAEESAPARVQSSRQAAKKPVPASQPRDEPDWLQGCSARQQSGGAILCDASSLLTQPSAKVQVYTREPSLARSTPGGPILLRESLPKLYRFFVLP